MGVLISCCRNSSSETSLITPDLETKRRQQAEAAERRMREQQSRGIKDPQRLQEKRERLERLEKKHEMAQRQGDQNTLKWVVD